MVALVLNEPMRVRLQPPRFPVYCLPFVTLVRCPTSRLCKIARLFHKSITRAPIHRLVPASRASSPFPTPTCCRYTLRTSLQRSQSLPRTTTASSVPLAFSSLCLSALPRYLCRAHHQRLANTRYLSSALTRCSEDYSSRFGEWRRSLHSFPSLACWYGLSARKTASANSRQAWFVNGFNDNNQLTPNFILVLFIVSILACAWAIATLVRLGSTRRSALFVAFIDLCFVGAFIAAVWYLRRIANADCTNFSRGDIYVNLGPFGYYGVNSNNSWAIHVNKNCAMLKASWAFGIMNIIFFFITFVLALFLHRHHREVVVKEVRRSRHGSRRGHSHSGSRRSSSRRRYYV